MTVATAGNLTGIAGVIAKWADNDADPYDRATQLYALARYLNEHTHQTGMGAPVANLAANVNHSVNGLLDIWQRPVQAYTTNAATAGPDRLFIALQGTDTISCTQNNASADTANGATYCVAAAFTLGTGAGATGIYEIFKLTNDWFRFFRGHTVTRTWRIKASVANAVRLQAASDGAGAVTTYSNYHTGDGTWQTLSVTITVPVDATYVEFDVKFYASGTHYIGAHSTVIGSNSVDPYVVALSPADDIARCMRYYQKFGGYSGDFYAPAYGATSTSLGIWVPFPVRMAITPTVAKVGTWNTINCGQPSTSNVSPNGFNLLATVTATGVMGFYCADTTTYVSAEANP